MAESELIRGNIDTVILRVLYEGDRYGYEMIKQINARSGGQLEIKQPTLYACLKRLEKQGFISSYWDGSETNGGRRKYYTLTDLGREVFIKYRDEFERSRDLFGNLISDESPLIAVDDFSDVEEDGYSVPKRRPSKPRAKPAATQQAGALDEPAATQAGDTPAEESETSPDIPPTYIDYTHSTLFAGEDSPAQEKPQAESEPEQPDLVDDGFVQQSFFDSLSNTETVNDATVEEEQTPEQAEETLFPPQPQDIDSQAEQEVAQPEKPAEKPPVTMRDALDPSEIINNIARSYNGGESFSSASARYTYENEYGSPAQPAVAEKPAEPKPVPAPATTNAVTVAQPTQPQPVPAKPSAPAPVPQHNNLPADINGESLARREYRDILSDLVERCEQTGDPTVPQSEQAAAGVAVEERQDSHRLSNVVQSVTELGNEVRVRDHNDSARIYSHKYYYYSNRLMMTHYAIMCGAMFLAGLMLFLAFYIGLGMRALRYDYLLYIFAGLLPIIMFITAVIIFATNPDKKKRINVNFRFSFIIRAVITIQVLVIIYCFNLIWGMPSGFSADYIPSLIIPAVYSLFIPISEVIIMLQLKSGRYAIE